MSDAIISIENLGKKYRLRHLADRPRYRALRDVITDSSKGLIRRLTSPGRGARVPAATIEDFWALRNVSFEIRQGEAVGIIGRNGAGKSTLLKILSRITEPSEGRVRIRGRVASLLEVGTGFHPELTGRENVYLNGAILGMSKAEIRRKFDEIVTFAEVEKFLDTPVKHYSSGMYVRLAFSVAAHMEPEILVVDEVLAVGDSTFQKKCLGKMDNIAGQGRTVLFVSHNMAVVQRLCQKSVLLSAGQLAFYGDTHQAVQLYLSGSRNSSSSTTVSEHQHHPDFNGARLIRLTNVTLANARNQDFSVRWRETIHLRFTFQTSAQRNNVVFGLNVSTAEGVGLLGVHSSDLGDLPHDLAPGEYVLDVQLQNPLTAGTYTISLGAHSAISRDILFLVLEAATFEVLDVSVDDRPYDHKNRVLINTEAAWQLTERQPELLGQPELFGRPELFGQLG
jgi:lipopolysaccharide transport system ATP-binding protein